MTTTTDKEPLPDGFRIVGRWNGVYERTVLELQRARVRRTLFRREKVIRWVFVEAAYPLQSMAEQRAALLRSARQWSRMCELEHSGGRALMAHQSQIVAIDLDILAELFGVPPEAITYREDGTIDLEAVRAAAAATT